MEKLLKSEQAYKRITITTLVVLVGLIIVNVFVVVFANKQINNNAHKLYVINKNKEFEASVISITENREAECKYHVQRFHELFFNIYPDAEGIETNINRAMYLSDESGKRLYNDLKERSFYTNIISSSTIQRCKIDSIQIDKSSTPYSAITYAKLEQSRATNRKITEIITTCTLDEMERSINSPNGLLIRNFKIVSSKDQ